MFSNTPSGGCSPQIASWSSGAATCSESCGQNPHAGAVCADVSGIVSVECLSHCQDVAGFTCAANGDNAALPGTCSCPAGSSKYVEVTTGLCKSCGENNNAVCTTNDDGPDYTCASHCEGIGFTAGSCGTGNPGCDCAEDKYVDSSGGGECKSCSENNNAVCTSASANPPAECVAYCGGQGFISCESG